MKKTMTLVTVILLLAGASFAEQKINPSQFPVKSGMLKPTIFNVTQIYIQGHHTVFLKGNFFGFAAGTREVRLGHHVLNTSSWAMQGIGADVPWNIPFGQKYPVSIWDHANNKLVSNEITFMLKFKIAFEDNGIYYSGSQIKFNNNKQNFGNIQGTRGVKLGDIEAPVVSWNNIFISVTVPPINPGWHDLYIEDNGEIVSFKEPVKILPPAK